MSIPQASLVLNSENYNLEQAYYKAIEQFKVENSFRTPIVSQPKLDKPVQPRKSVKTGKTGDIKIKTRSFELKSPKRVQSTVSPKEVKVEKAPEPEVLPKLPLKLRLQHSSDDSKQKLIQVESPKSEIKESEIKKDTAIQADTSKPTLKAKESPRPSIKAKESPKPEVKSKFAEVKPNK